MKISVVINTRNEEKNIGRCLKSVGWADEVIVVDQRSEDKTVEIAKKAGAKVFSFKHTRFVEPARNFAISKASGDWILVVDADEEVPSTLVKKLRKIATSGEADYVRIPRQNIIFNQWIKTMRWWPDYIVRFFKKDHLEWSDKIHSVPLTKGRGMDLPAKKQYAIVHHNYQSMSQYLERLGRYTDAQAAELVESGYQIQWRDLIQKPLSEWLSRFFAARGYKDGIHGLALSFLQAFSELVVYLKVWEIQGFKKQELPLKNFLEEMGSFSKEVAHWLKQSLVDEAGDPFKKIWLKLKHKLS